MAASPDCECYRRVNPNDATDPGRNFELCSGQFHHGRKPPSLASWNAWRAERGLPPLNNVPPARTDHKARGGSVKISGNTEKQAEKPWDVSQPSRGLGDVVAKITHATGIDKLVKAMTGKKGCGCKGRQAALNAAVPFKG